MKLVVMVKMAKPVILMVLLIQFNFVIMVKITKLVVLMFLVQEQKIKKYLVLFFYSYSESINFYFQLLLETEKRKCFCYLFLVRKVVSSQNYANGGGGEVEASCGVVVASRRFQIAIFQIK